MTLIDKTLRFVGFGYQWNILYFSKHTTTICCTTKSMSNRPEYWVIVGCFICEIRTYYRLWSITKEQRNRGYSRWLSRSLLIQCIPRRAESHPALNSLDSWMRTNQKKGLVHQGIDHRGRRYSPLIGSTCLLAFGSRFRYNGKMAPAQKTATTTQ